MKKTNAYLEYCQGAEDTGEWVELLPVGSNPQAPAALNTLYCRLPTSPGTFIWEGYDIVFTLTVEGEQSLLAFWHIPLWIKTRIKNIILPCKQMKIT